MSLIPSEKALIISGNWKLQDLAKVSQPGAVLSKPGFEDKAWHGATVPGTVLSSLVDQGVYPEPLYGENNRPDRIPESLCRSSYWYRNEFTVPAILQGRRIFLNFDGINYAAEVWVNGHQAGGIKGAFTRGIFDVTELLQPGKAAALAVLVSPQPNPGEPHEHTIAAGMGANGGITAIDGPTFLCSIGWDWIPAIRDRNTGIWRKVFLSSTGPVAIQDPLLTSDLPLPKLAPADLTLQVGLKNLTLQAQKGLLKGAFGDVWFEKSVELAPGESRQLKLDPSSLPQLRIQKPELWWPNGFGAQHLYPVKLSFEVAGEVSDLREFKFGIRKIEYAVPDTENLTLSVNGVRLLCKGGNWGMDEAMKRIPRARLEAQIRMHQIANFTMIRNWVGQSTNEDFYDLCDQYGLLLWDEFFQPNPSDGPNPTDLETYIANVREKILRFRNHASIAVWCGRNEGHPPKEIDDLLTKLMAELEPVRHYQSSSTDGKGVKSDGPYYWREPRHFFEGSEPFKTELGSVSVPTLESIQGMMPKKDWETVNDDWAEHDMARGAQRGDKYPGMIDSRYGKAVNLADFVRKAQLANYEAHRAMFEGRNATLFHPSSGVLMWMSNPAQPSFVWQIYHHDLEPNASLFAARKACEIQHIQFNEKEGSVEVINNLGDALSGKARLRVYNLDGKVVGDKSFEVSAKPFAATTLGQVEWPAGLSAVHFLKLELSDAAGKLVSDNFYWRGQAIAPDDFSALESLPVTTLDAQASRETRDGKCLITVTLHNPGPQVALMAHLQLHRQGKRTRVLPVYYSDNYLSLVPGETRVVQVEAALSDLEGDAPLLLVDGWNIQVKPFAGTGVALDLNQNAQVGSWPKTGLPMLVVKP